MQFDLKRLQPHDGDLMSGWVCCYACEHGWTEHPRKGQQGWFAIPRGTAHEYDPTANVHIHSECATELRDRERWVNAQQLRAQPTAGDAA